jgi:hypothetical protein
MEKTDYKVQEELELLGIEIRTFNKIYESIKDNNVFPEAGDASAEQYLRIKVYLQSKRVLRKDLKVDSKVLNTFKVKKDLEDMLEEVEKYKDVEMGSAGGMGPCRYEDDLFPRSNGGIAPCREHPFKKY